MTTTTLINGVTVGTTANPASNVTKATLAASTGAMSIQAKLVAGVKFETGTIRVWWAHCADSVTADATAYQSLKFGGNFIEFPKQVIGGSTVFLTSELEGIRGGYVYVWVEEPVLNATATLTVKITEV